MKAARFLGDVMARLRSTSGILWKAEAAFKGVTCGKNVTFLGRPLISVASSSRLILDENVTVVSALRSNPLGCFQPSVLRTMADGAELRLSSGVGISATVICAGKQIIIGENTIIGAGSMLIDNDFHALEPDDTWREEYLQRARPILIGKCVFIGARAIILKGAEIGDYSIIGAGSVVTGYVPPHTIFAGNPAREIGKARGTRP